MLRGRCSGARNWTACCQSWRAKWRPLAEQPSTVLRRRRPVRLGALPAASARPRGQALHLVPNPPLGCVAVSGCGDEPQAEASLLAWAARLIHRKPKAASWMRLVAACWNGTCCYATCSTAALRPMYRYHVLHPKRTLHLADYMCVCPAPTYRF